MSRVEAIIYSDEDVAEVNAEVCKVFWNVAMTKLLIKTYGDMEYEMTDGRTRKVVCWENIAKLMCSYGYRLTSKNCKDKWGNLKKQFGVEKRSQNKSGHEPSQWPYFDAMDEVLGKKPEFSPLTLASNIGGIRHLSQAIGQAEREAKVTSNDETEYTQTKKRPFDNDTASVSERQKLNDSIEAREIKRRQRHTNTLQDKIEEMRRERAEQYERTYEQRERFLNALEKLSDKENKN